ncbi:hypothetical protein SIN8267_02759 [Sinobacterium norvegicum]|uniref:Uncharacterized protein n=1 Tax=Sinobacterium norvegicum TaxID=1641715 RepID=A0ABN8EJT1_9GAMM|nr:hypothetical protein [Sinobacterium norvegicum]CAH0992626.1 hypothetical protein SIN8267_02759 [Sinobacterium norvegicum]
MLSINNTVCPLLCTLFLAIATITFTATSAAADPLNIKVYIEGKTRSGNTIVGRADSNQAVSIIGSQWRLNGRKMANRFTQTLRLKDQYVGGTIQYCVTVIKESMRGQKTYCSNNAGPIAAKVIQSPSISIAQHPTGTTNSMQATLMANHQAGF